MRLLAAKVPELAQVLKTKPQIVLELLERSWREAIPRQWVVADTTYGDSPAVRQAIALSGRYKVMELGARHQLLFQGKRRFLNALATTLGTEDWLTLSRLELSTD